MKKFLMLLIAGTLTLSITGCKEKTTSEKLGDAMEQAADDAKQAADDAKKAVDEAAK
jgi:hypothetical protein